MKKTIFVSLSAIVSLLTAVPTLAQTTHTIDASQNKAIAVKIHPGYSVNLSFMQTDEHITYANLADPSGYSMSFDEILCKGNQSCEAGQPQLIHLRLLQGVNLPNITTSPGGKTFLTVKTKDTQQRSYLYVFHLSAARGQPSYHTLSMRNAQSSAPFSHNAILKANTSNLIDLTHVAEGITWAQSEQRLPDNPALWQRVHRFIALVKQGHDYVEAIAQSGVSSSLVRKLEAWGRGADRLSM